jgi:hypothetical protein
MFKAMIRPVPDQIVKDAATHGELVVFVGAGASKLCGSPSWSDFANSVVATLQRAGKLSFLEAEQLKALGDPRRTLSIAIAMAEESALPISFDGILHPGIPNDDGAELYRVLTKLRPVFVTTNYDRWLDEGGLPETSAEPGVGTESTASSLSVKHPKYYRREQLTPSLLAERGSVIHLHGSYVDPSSMVVSLKDYIEHYADERVQAFLAEMFRNYTVLFVGYGLAELEVLDYIVRSNESLRSNVVEPRHYLLYPCRSTEHVQTRFIERFYKDQCGVQVLPYCIDENGYSELLEVFKSWAPALDVRDPTRLELELRIDRYVASANSPSKESALRLVKTRPELAMYFINSLKDICWFEDLQAAGFFEPGHSPGVKVVDSEKGQMFQAEGWPALRYLEYAAAAANDAQAGKIIEIVRSVTQDAVLRKLDNWRTWWSLATVMAQLPLNAISAADIQMVESWLTGRFDADMVANELGEKLLPRLLESPDPAHWEMAESLVALLTMSKPLEART